MEPGRFFDDFELVLNGFEIDFYMILSISFSMIFPKKTKILPWAPGRPQGTLGGPGKIFEFVLEKLWKQ